MQSYTDLSHSTTKSGKPSLYVPTLSNSDSGGFEGSGDRATAGIHGS